jgi:hypothetical protein
MSSSDSGPVLRLTSSLKQIKLVYDKAIAELNVQLLDLTNSSRKRG